LHAFLITAYHSTHYQLPTCKFCHRLRGFVNQENLTGIKETTKVILDYVPLIWIQWNTFYLIMESHYNIREGCKLEEHKVDELAGEMQPEPVAV
jgi:hypothetical protein